ncbi:MAG: protein-L-isoaspartate(D-aspartate) O-methyltransferase [Pirellulales bacterium]
MLRYFLTTVIVFSGLLTMSSSGFAQPAAAKQVQFSVPSRKFSADRYANARERMVREDIAASGVTNTRVLESMRLTPRHEFVTTAQRPLAYFDMSLPIGERQTISGPFVVAYMTEQLDPKPTDRVLEIGTGSGYQAAILSPLVGTVYSIEIHDALGRRARSTLRRLGYTNVVTKIGDGFMGWAEKGPFDKIIVTCSPEEIPLPLIDQLVEDGIMIIPVGERYEQTLVRLQKRAGKLERTDLVPSLFVPMTGEAEERRAVLPNGVKPRLANSSFEECLPDSETPTAWYYGRQEALLENGNSPDGRRHLLLKNSEPGRPAHIFQGFPIDGRSVRELKISYQVRVAGLGSGRIPAEKPGVAIRFFDERRARSTRLVAPLRILNSEWTLVTGSLLVPTWSREAILQVGLMGATGQIEVDKIQIVAVERP